MTDWIWIIVRTFVIAAMHRAGLSPQTMRDVMRELFRFEYNPTDESLSDIVSSISGVMPWPFDHEEDDDELEF